MAQQTVYSQNRENDPRSPYYKPKGRTLQEQTGLGSLLPLDRPQQQVSPNIQNIEDYTRKPRSASPEYPGPAGAIWNNLTGGGEQSSGEYRPTQSDFQGNGSPIGSSGSYPSMNPILLDMNANQPQISPEQIAQYNQLQQTLLDKTGDLQADVDGALAPQQAQAASAPLPISAPSLLNPSKDILTKPTEGQKNAATSTVSTIFKSQQPSTGIAGANANDAHDKIQSDILKVSDSKDPSKTWQNLKQQPFYQNSSFYTGLVGVGLAIASGRDPLEAFQVGQAMSQQSDMKEQLSSNRDALLDQGYSPDSIANAISKGDPSLLKMTQMSDQDRMAAQLDIDNQQYARSRADRLEDRQNQQNFQLQRDSASDARYEKRMNDQLQKSKDLITFRDQLKQSNAQTQAQSFNFGSRDLNAEKNTPEGSNIKQWSTKRGYFTAADKEHQLAQDAIIRWNKSGKEADRQDAVAAFKQLVFNLARGEIGENRSLQGSDLAEFAEDPSIPVRTINDIKLKSGFTPTLDALRYVKSGIDTGIQSMDYNINNTKEQRIRANAITLGPRKATALVNRAFGGGFHDPLNAFGEEAKDAGVDVIRPGGALSGDPAWMEGQQ